jgi:hypothetical protein
MMDLMLLRLYQRQVVFQCNAVLFGAQDMQPIGQHTRFWHGAQNLIIGAGNLSKTLWGTGNKDERNRRFADRQPLRDSLGVTDASPLRRVDIRNDYEHLDERLERWWAESTHHNYVGEMIGPRGSIGGAGIGDKDILRWFDQSTGDLIFWGNELNVPVVLAEVRKLLPIAAAEAEKSHYDSSKKAGGGQ